MRTTTSVTQCTMDIAQLRCFVAVSRARNIGKAAELLHLTPSPVSRTIRQVENELGTVLFERRYHELAPTEAASHLLPRAVEILALVDSLVPSSAGHGLRVGATPWAPTRFAARIARAMESLSEESGRIEEEMSSVLLQLLSHGDLDLAVVHLPVELPGVSVRALARYRFYALSSPDAGLPTQTVPLSALSGRSALILPIILQPSPMLALRQKLLDAGVTDVIEIDFADVLTLESRLRRTGAIMLGNKVDDTPLSQILARMDLQATPVDLDDIDFEVGVAWRTEDSLRGSRVRAIVDILRPPGTEIEVV